MHSPTPDRVYSVSDDGILRRHDPSSGAIAAELEDVSRVAATGGTVLP
jgi:hypothetical protein